jgi:hypothetical protein
MDVAVPEAGGQDVPGEIKYRHSRRERHLGARADGFDPAVPSDDDSVADRRALGRGINGCPKEGKAGVGRLSRYRGRCGDERGRCEYKGLRGKTEVWLRHLIHPISPSPGLGLISRHEELGPPSPLCGFGDSARAHS